MKKKVGIILVAIALGLVMASCHMNEICPAYADSSETTENTESKG